MEKLIEIQLTNLYSQRESFALALSQASPNEPNFTILQNELRISIEKIDMEINNAMMRIENLSIQQLNKIQ